MRPVSLETRDGAVVEARAVADTVAERIEGGKRNKHDLGIENPRIRTRTERAETLSTSGAPATSSRKTMVCRSRIAGTQSRAPRYGKARHQRPQIDFRTDRQEAGDDRVQRKTDGLAGMARPLLRLLAGAFLVGDGVACG